MKFNQDNEPIPFYGASNPEMFAIERRCMDPDGLVLAYLDKQLPAGPILDIGAGNGFTSMRLKSPVRHIYPLEPAIGMIDVRQPLAWTQGMAQHLPYKADSFNGAYATWAYFLGGMPNRQPGLVAAKRVLRASSPIIIIDNAGGDELTSYTERTLADNGSFYLERGFTRTIIESSYRFADVAEAQRLLGFYFGVETGRSVKKTRISFNIAAYIKHI